MRKKDIELNSTREKLIYSEKLAAIGTLAMGSEFRTNIAEIKDALTNLHMKLPQEDDLKKDIIILEENFTYIDNVFGTFAILNDAICLKTEEIDFFDFLVVTLDRYSFPEGIVLESNIDENIPVLQGDREKLEKILLTVINNAVRASAQKAVISIDAYVDDGQIVVSVIDKGEGLDEKYIKCVSEPNIVMENIKLSLGLSTASLLVESHGGRMDVDSKKGEGTTVTIYIPLSK